MPSFKDEINVHQSTTSNSFATSPSVNVQSVSLSLQPVETRAAWSEVTNPAVFAGELGATFSSTYARLMLSKFGSGSVRPRQFF